MNVKNAAMIIMRVISIFLIYMAIPKVSDLLYHLDEMANVGAVNIILISMVILLPTITAVIMAVLIWQKAAVFSNYFFSNSEKGLERPASGSLIELEKIAYSLLGVYILANSIPTTAHHVSFILLSKIFGSNPEILKPSVLSQYIFNLVQLLLGLWLFLGAKGINRNR